MKTLIPCNARKINCRPAEHFNNNNATAANCQCSHKVKFEGDLNRQNLGSLSLQTCQLHVDALELVSWWLIVQLPPSNSLQLLMTSCALFEQHSLSMSVNWLLTLSYKAEAEANRDVNDSKDDED